MSKFYDFLRAHLRFFLYIKKRRKQSAIEIGDFMAEDLQNLIDRIQNEAVAKAGAQSAEIIAKAVLIKSHGILMLARSSPKKP